MRLIRDLTAPGARAPCVVAIGSFDGLHLGHRALIERTRALAGAQGLQSVLLSFEPLPREFLRAADPPPRLTNLRERWRLLAPTGLDALCLLRFNNALRSLTGVAFLERLAAFGARVLVVGHDFRFGRGGEATAEWCREQAPRLGMSAQVVEAVCAQGERISSGAVRAALASGDLRHAERLLGRPYTMRGRVRRGQQLGRTLGFPTANIAVKRRRVPLAGVFAVRVDGPGATRWPGVASLGTRPMVGGVEVLLETHLFDFAGDLYGQELTVQFVERLRDERMFESMAAMVEQIGHDAAAARRVLAAQ